MKKTLRVLIILALAAGLFWFGKQLTQDSSIEQREREQSEQIDNTQTEENEQNIESIQTGNNNQQPGIINRKNKESYSIRDINFHYSEREDRFDASQFSEEDLYWLKRQDAPQYTYPKEVQNFIEKKGYYPGYFFVTLFDSDYQLIAERDKNDTIESWLSKNQQLKVGPYKKEHEEIEEFLINLDKQYKIKLIDRTEINNHTPEQTGIYRNNYYRIKFMKRDNNQYELNDENIQELFKRFPYKTSTILNNIYQNFQQNSNPNDPDLSNTDRYLNQVKAGEGRNAIRKVEGTMPNPGEGKEVIGLIDNGTMTSHEDLKANIISYNNNGNGHGTHTAGSVGATTNNNIGVPAISYNYIKVAAAGGGLTTHNTKTRTDRAIDQGAIAVSWSRGCPGTKESGDNMRGNRIKQRSKTLFIIAAGNDNQNPSTQDSSQARCGNFGISYRSAGNRGFYPAHINSDNVITVAASTTNDNRANFSNYGEWIELAAPGVNIASTLEPGNENYCRRRNGPSRKISNGYGYCDGTSMATPIVASLVGLIKGLPKGQKLSATEIKQIIMDTADPVDREGGAGRINVCAAVAKIGYPCLDYDTPVKPEPSCTDGINTHDNENSGQEGNTVPTPECNDPTCSPPDITLQPASICTTGTITPVMLSVELPDGATQDFNHKNYQRTTSPNIGSSNSSSFTIDQKIDQDITVILEARYCFDDSCTEYCAKTGSTTITARTPSATDEGADPDPSSTTPNQCKDGIDNDCDGTFDCNEPDNACLAHCGICTAMRNGLEGNPGPHDASCGPIEGPFPGTIPDGINCKDCKHPSCKIFPRCGDIECHCCDNIDNDGDGITDYYDSDCCIERDISGRDGICLGSTQKCKSDVDCPGSICVSVALASAGGNKGGGGIVKKYSCQGNECTIDPNGTYSSPTCDNQCINTCTDTDECKNNTDCGTDKICSSECTCKDKPTTIYTLYDYGSFGCSPCRGGAEKMSANDNFLSAIQNGSCSLKIRLKAGVDKRKNEYPSLKEYTAPADSTFNKKRDRAGYSLSIPFYRIEDENENVIKSKISSDEFIKFAIDNCK